MMCNFQILHLYSYVALVVRDIPLSVICHHLSVYPRFLAARNNFSIRNSKHSLFIAIVRQTALIKMQLKYLWKILNGEVESGIDGSEIYWRHRDFCNCSTSPRRYVMKSFHLSVVNVCDMKFFAKCLFSSLI